MRKRIDFIDYSKGLGIFFVVFGHVYCGNNIVTNWIYSFHMPLFFILSGFLLYFEKERNFKKLFLRKCKSLIIPYLTFSIINMIGNYFIKDMSINSLKIDSLNIFTLYGLYALWFLITLFIAECIFLFSKNNIKKKRNKVLFYLVIIGVALVLVFINYKYHNKALKKFNTALIRSIVGLMFINIGYYLYKFISKINLKVYQILIIALISIGGSVLNKPVNLSGLQFNNLFLYVFNSITGSLTIIFFSKKINESRILNFLGKNTLIIMATHQLIIEAILKSSLIKYLNGIMIIFIISLLEYPLIKIINKYLPFMLGKKREKSIVNKENNVVIG